MANMSYCRFENTLIDLQDCYDALANEGIESLSEREKKKAIRLIKLCSDIVNDEFIDTDQD